jgi:uncharacterized protein (DUF1778 family)
MSEETEKQQLHHLMTLLKNPTSDAKSLAEAMIVMMPVPENTNEVFRAQARSLINSVMLALVEMRNAGDVQLSGYIIFEYLQREKVMMLARRRDLSAPTIAALKHFLTANGWLEDKDDHSQFKMFSEQFGYASAYFKDAVRMLVQLEDQPIDRIEALIDDPNSDAQSLAEAFIAAIPSLPEDKSHAVEDAKALITAFMPALFELCDLNDIPLSIGLIRNHLIFDNVVALAMRSDLSALTTSALQSFLASMNLRSGTEDQSSLLSKKYYCARDCFSQAINRLVLRNTAAHLMALLGDPASNAESLSDAMIAMIPRADWMPVSAFGSINKIYSKGAQALMHAVMLALVEMRDKGEIQLSVRTIHEYLNLNSVMALARRDDLSKLTVITIREFLRSVGWIDDKEDQGQFRSLPEHFGYARSYFSSPLRALLRFESTGIL